MSTITLNPLRIFADIWQNRYLLSQLIKRDVLLRYRGAMFGVLWISLVSLTILRIYSIVANNILRRNGTSSQAQTPSVLILYRGLSSLSR